VKFCQLVVSLSTVLLQLNLTKITLEHLKSDFMCKKKIKTNKKHFLHHSEFDFFRVKLKFAFRIRPLFFDL